MDGQKASGSRGERLLSMVGVRLKRKNSSCWRAESILKKVGSEAMTNESDSRQPFSSIENRQSAQIHKDESGNPYRKVGSYDMSKFDLNLQNSLDSTDHEIVEILSRQENLTRIPTFNQCSQMELSMENGTDIVEGQDHGNSSESKKNSDELFVEIVPFLPEQEQENSIIRALDPCSTDAGLVVDVVVAQPESGQIDTQDEICIDNAHRLNLQSSLQPENLIFPTYNPPNPEEESRKDPPDNKFMRSEENAQQLRTSERSRSSSSCSLCESRSCRDSTDDSLRDTNFEASSSSSDSEPEATQLKATPEKSRKRKANQHEWMKSRAKRLRNLGKSYKTLGKGVEVAERRMKPACGIDKCSQKCSSKFSEAERHALFKQYWDLGDIIKQRTFILSLLQEVNPKYQYTQHGKRRVVNHSFHLLRNDQKVKVCKNFFMATLGITARCIRTIKEKIKARTLAEDNRGRHAYHKEVPNHIKDGVRSHISSIPTIESHYTRQHTEKRYIEGSKTIAQLHRDYKTECESQGKPFANLTMYRKIFNYEFNIAFFVPKKDQCQSCVSYENSNEEQKSKLEEQHKRHIEEKVLSREEKEMDKQNISSAFQVACFPLFPHQTARFRLFTTDQNFQPTISLFVISVVPEKAQSIASCGTNAREKEEQ